MKVVQINVTYGNADSTGRNVKELHEYLLNKDICSYVYTSKINDDSKTDKHIRMFSSKLDKLTHAFLSRVTGLQGHFSTASTKKLLQELSEDKPDIVILHTLHGNCINFPMLCDYLGKNNIPTVLVLHDCWYFTGHCCHYSQIDCQEWQHDCRHCPQMHEWNKSWFFDTAYRSLQEKKRLYQAIPRLGVVGVSDWITEEAKKSILKDATLIQRIYNWIDVETFTPRNTTGLRKQLGIAEGERVLLGVATAWNERKGLKEMLLVAKSIPESKVIMVGKMPGNIKIPKNMICVGQIKDPVKLSEYYSMADLFLNPSVQETFGKTTVEAMSCGTPAIVYNTTACKELIGDGCGKVIQEIDKTIYTDSAMQYLRKLDKFTEENCRNFAYKMFLPDDCMKKYVEVLNDLQFAERKD